MMAHPDLKKKWRKMKMIKKKKKKKKREREREVGLCWIRNNRYINWRRRKRRREKRRKAIKRRRGRSIKFADGRSRSSGRKQRNPQRLGCWFATRVRLPTGWPTRRVCRLPRTRTRVALGRGVGTRLNREGRVGPGIAVSSNGTRRGPIVAYATLLTANPAAVISSSHPSGSREGEEAMRAWRNYSGRSEERHVEGGIRGRGT
ncbi:hypothetical protein B296_00038629 [Ensete ventricosum]|uniref:Uncharacterized protein n=1 Tax=Ensete ventricosum TaxID=4639 RepID=A0A426ZVT5_ENSVE|nr:hypothetical protein B296_00038629 [Ensete ventricosum]